MKALPAETRSRIPERFLADHERLDILFTQLLSALEANAGDRASLLWKTFERDLLAHMKMEDTYLIPSLHRTSPTSARVLIQEHRHLRTRLSELGALMTAPSVRLRAVVAFGEELRAHTKSETRLLYPWADEHVPEDAKKSALDSLAGPVSGR